MLQTTGGTWELLLLLFKDPRGGHCPLHGDRIARAFVIHLIHLVRHSDPSLPTMQSMHGGAHSDRQAAPDLSSRDKNAAKIHVCQPAPAAHRDEERDRRDNVAEGAEGLGAPARVADAVH
jgi:hypothetical protein